MSKRKKPEETSNKLDSVPCTKAWTIGYEVPSVEDPLKPPNTKLLKVPLSSLKLGPILLNMGKLSLSILSPTNIKLNTISNIKNVHIAPISDNKFLIEYNGIESREIHTELTKDSTGKEILKIEVLPWESYTAFDNPLAIIGEGSDKFWYPFEEGNKLLSD